MRRRVTLALLVLVAAPVTAQRSLFKDQAATERSMVFYSWERPFELSGYLERNRETGVFGLKGLLVYRSGDHDPPIVNRVAILVDDGEPREFSCDTSPFDIDVREDHGSGGFRCAMTEEDLEWLRAANNAVRAQLRTMNLGETPILAITGANLTRLRIFRPGEVSPLEPARPEDEFARDLPVGAGLPPSMRLNQGIARFNAGDLEAALEDFDRALGEDPEMASAYYYRGVTHLTLGRNAQALADLRKYVEIVGLAGAHTDEASAFLEYLGSSH